MTQNSAASAEYARQVTTASLRVAQLENQLADANSRVEQVEEYIRVQRQHQATKMENLDQVNTEVIRLRGQIEVLQFELAALRDDASIYQLQQEKRQLHDERRLRQLEEFLGVTPPPIPRDGLGVEGPSERPGAPVEEAETVEAPKDAAGMLQVAKDHLASGRLGVARALLRRALQEYPNASEADEIAYQLAETHLAEKNFGKAALTYKSVIEDYPASPWASWSMLRQGECFEGLGQADNARLFFDGVIQRYPQSDAAKEAKEKLNR